MDGDSSNIAATISYEPGDKTSSIELQFAAITADDAGDYKCIAAFESTVLESEVATVAVYGKLSPLSTSSFHCKVKHSPKGPYLAGTAYSCTYLCFNYPSKITKFTRH